MIILLSFALAMLTTTVTLPALRTHAAKLGLVDRPDTSRKVHTESTPHSGGVAIVLGVLVASLVYIPSSAGYFALFGCIAIIVLFGLLDDLRELGHRSKFLSQAIASALLLATYGGFQQIPFLPLDSAPAWLTLAFSFVFLIGVTNAVNLSDGLDGLAAGNGLLSLIILALFSAQAEQTALLVLALALAGGLVGFLRFNTHPASIFMGDTGSQFIGFTAAALAMLIAGSEQTPLGALVPLLIFGLPILDTFTVIAIRKWRGRPVFSADRSHLHHQLLAVGLHHYEVVIILYILQAVCVGMAYQMRFEPDLLVLGAYLLFCVMVLTTLGVARVNNWRVHSKSAGDHGERRNLILRRLSWYQVNTARVLAPMLGAVLLFAGLEHNASVELSRTALAALAIIALVWIVLHKRMVMVTRTVCYLAGSLAIYGLLLDGPTTEHLFGLDIAIGALAVMLALAIRLTRKTQFHLDSQDYLTFLIVVVAPLLLPSSLGGPTAARIVVYLAVMLYATEYIATKGKLTRWALCAVGAASIALVAI